MKMQDKRAKQLQQQAEHKVRLQAQKASRQPQALPGRAAPTRPERARLLLVCQGEETEPSYFEQFRLTSATVHTIPYAQDPRSLVEAALALRQEAEETKEAYDHVWCVFDKDDSPAEQFNGAVERGRAQGLGMAYSNQAFEYWLLLHFEAHQGSSLHRDHCRTKLLGYLPAGLGFEGRKGKRIGRVLFDALCSLDAVSGQPRPQLAIRRAQANAERWQADGLPPAEQESTTLVYQLVQQLLGYQ